MKSQIKQIKPQEIALGAVLAAVVTVATMFLSVPIPGNTGYFNMGEAIIYTIALTLGARYAGFAGAIGAALADLFLFPTFAPFTFVIKGIEGYVVGTLAEKSRLLALLAGAVVLIAGYGVTTFFLFGIANVPAELLTDTFQSGAGALVALTLAPLLERRRGISTNGNATPQS